MIKSSDIRQQFIDFFISKKHSIKRSSSVVPLDDPTLLFTNAGMNQFKSIFLDQEIPDKTRLVNSQKCIRVSGKHNDLEEVGVDDYHHTFFEMLGNWSFGDYYKEEAIQWAWELLTEVWKIDKKRLWVSVYKDDDETKELWINKTDIDPSRVLRCGKKDNFWEMGETGPCGPCTEIHYYFGDDIDGQNSKGVNNDDLYREIWNLVFIQYNRDKNGNLNDLPQKHVDTGMGLERVVGVLNNESSNYETDLFQPIIKLIESTSKVKYNTTEKGIPHRVIADHIRMLCFSIADGAMPSNEGRGYVIRRVLRRASRFCRTLGMKNQFLYTLVDLVADIMKDSYPEIKEKISHIKNVIKSEEESFGQTLDKGLEVFDSIINDLDKNIILGKDAFKLYDTYGFPIDLTRLMAKEKKISIDEKGFLNCMDKQKKRSKSNSEFKISDNDVEWISKGKIEPSVFIGYSDSTSTSKIIKFRNIEDNKFEIVTDVTPFYAESGGQVGDSGYIKNKNLIFKVIDTQKRDKDISHVGILENGEIKLGENVTVDIDKDRRSKIKSNHTATHILHESLKQILGEHVQQSGSLVTDQKLRFDLTHYEKITDVQIIEIENKINEIIRQNYNVSTTIQDFDEAKENGATALFGEKYEDKVRVVDIPNFSMELCGGTHVLRTGDIGAFKIVSESSLSTGVRRIEAITGQKVIDRIHYIDSIIKQSKNLLKTNENQILEKATSLINKNKELEKKIKEGFTLSSSFDLDKLISKANTIHDIKVVLHNIENYDGDLKELGDQFRVKFKDSAIIIISSVLDDKINIMCAITDNLTSVIDASEISKQIGKKIDGGGGGKKHIATAGGKNIIEIDDLFKQINDFLLKYLN